MIEPVLVHDQVLVPMPNPVPGPVPVPVSNPVPVSMPVPVPMPSSVPSRVPVPVPGLVPVPMRGPEPGTTQHLNKFRSCNAHGAHGCLMRSSVYSARGCPFAGGTLLRGEIHTFQHSTVAL